MTGYLGKCETPGCPAHIYPGQYCADCKQPTTPYREWVERMRKTHGIWAGNLRDDEPNDD